MNIIDGGRPGSDPVGYVRYTAWRERESNASSDRLFGSRHRRQHRMAGPSGTSYSFRESNGTSQWLPVRRREDLQHFEEAEDYEVRRE